VNWSFKYREFRDRLRHALRLILTRLLMAIPIETFASHNLHLHDLDDVESFEKWLERFFSGVDREDFLRAEQPSRRLRIFEALFVTKDARRLKYCSIWCSLIRWLEASFWMVWPSGRNKFDGWWKFVAPRKFARTWSRMSASNLLISA